MVLACPAWGNGGGAQDFSAKTKSYDACRRLRVVRRACRRRQVERPQHRMPQQYREPERGSPNEVARQRDALATS
jgi:hypothetical protein